MATKKKAMWGSSGYSMTKKRPKSKAGRPARKAARKKK